MGLSQALHTFPHGSEDDHDKGEGAAPMYMKGTFKHSQVTVMEPCTVKSWMKPVTQNIQRTCSPEYIKKKIGVA